MRFTKRQRELIPEQRQGEALRKERSIIYRDDDEGGRARVTTDR